VITGDPDLDPEGARARRTGDERVAGLAPMSALVDRAAALRTLLIEQAPETERRTYYSQELHEAFDEAGFYRMLVPRRYGGLEVDLGTFLRVIAEVAAGDLSAAWCLCLASAHALHVGTLYEERAQAELFGDGDFRSPAVAAPTGSAVRTDDGWRSPARGPTARARPMRPTSWGRRSRRPKRRAGRPARSCCSSRRAASGRC